MHPTRCGAEPSPRRPHRVLRVDPSALALGDEALDAARQSGDRKTEGHALYHTSWWRHTTDRDAAMAEVETASRSLETGDAWGAAMSLAEKGTILSEEGRPELAVEALEEGAAVCAALGDRYIVNTIRYYLGRALAFVGRTADSVDMFEAVIDHARTTSDTFSMTMTQADLAMQYAWHGEHDRAARLALENVARFDDGKLPWLGHAVQANGTTATVLYYDERYEDTLPFLHTALRLTRNVPTTELFVAATLAGLALASTPPAISPDRGNTSSRASLCSTTPHRGRGRWHAKDSRMWRCGSVSSRTHRDRPRHARDVDAARQSLRSGWRGARARHPRGHLRRPAAPGPAAGCRRRSLPRPSAW